MVGLYFLLICKKLKNPSSRLYLVHHKTLLDLKTESPLFPREAVETPQIGQPLIMNTSGHLDCYNLAGHRLEPLQVLRDQNLIID